MKNHTLLITFLVTFMSGCAGNPVMPTDAHRNNLENGDAPKIDSISYGLIKKELVVAVSTQADVIKKFGSPNNMVYQSGGGELWIYDRIQSETTIEGDSSSSGVAIGGFTGGAGGLLGSKRSQNSAKTSSSIRVLTVILDFNEKGVLVDITARQGGY
jgi:hypothetical protein